MPTTVEVLAVSMVSTPSFGRLSAPVAGRAGAGRFACDGAAFCVSLMSQASPSGFASDAAAFARGSLARLLMGLAGQRPVRRGRVAFPPQRFRDSARPFGIGLVSVTVLARLVGSFGATASPLGYFALLGRRQLHPGAARLGQSN